MARKFRDIFKSNPYEKRIKDIDPDEIFLDSQNLPKFDVNQFEGRLEKPIPQSTFAIFGIACFLIFIVFFFRSFDLQIVNGKIYFQRSQNNMLDDTVLFANRGVISDRNGTPLAWNVTSSSTDDQAFSLRKYIDLPGLAHVLGYVKYPSKDSSGFYYKEDFSGEAGVEKYYNDTLSGTNGMKIVEVDAAGKLQSESVAEPPVDGQNLTLSIDSKLQNEMYNTISSLAQSVGFTGGAGVIMNVNTGEVLAMTSYPEYNSQILTDGTDTAAINQYLTNKNNPFLNRITDGLYTPGSIVKPYMSMAALTENIIDPNKKILSTGSISIPNPYNPSIPSVFNDWRPQGWIDMEQAIAVSSDVYFYEVGGGYQDQKGLGINLIKKYMNMFGLGEDLPNGFFSGETGTVPDPAWKAVNFNGQAWNIGDTYHTSIGQYGFQVTPIQMVRAVASIANNGKLMDPSILLGGNPNDFIQLNLNPANFQIVRDGMHLGTQTGGVAVGLDVDYLSLAAKTGTAELGTQKQFVNSWVTGFFPYDNPKYAFAVIMEKGPESNDLGGVYVMRQVLDWMHVNEPQYLQ
jgi:penicillin-binding protein 2